MALGKKKMLHQAATGLVATENFAPFTYTGTVGGQSLTGLGFQPDLVWIKARTGSANSHMWQDSVRGANKTIISNSDSQELTSTDFFTSFDSDGFTLPANSGTQTNNNGIDYVAWCWKGGGNSNTFNVDGTGYSTASAAGLTAGNNNPTGASVNTASGFSIVKYTTSGGSGTVAHGLNDTPEVVLLKRTSAASDWYFFTTVIDGSMDLLRLNSNTFQIADTTQAFTSTTFKDWGGSGDWIAYCIKSITGYSSIGNYEGTGASGNAQDIGFQPRLVLLKRTDNTSGWYLMDSVRGEDKQLYPEFSGSEGTLNIINITSTGFNFGGSTMNIDDAYYIYWAIA